MLNGVYVRAENETMNSAPVFKFCGDEAFGYDDIICFLDQNKLWRVCSKSAHVDAKNNVCYLMGYEQGTLSPIGGRWKIFGGKQWDYANDIESTMIDDPEDIFQAMKYKERCRRERVERAAKYPGIRFEGIVGQAKQNVMNGNWIKIEGVTKNKHPVYEFMGGTCFGNDDMVLFYDKDGRWRAASRSKHMDGDKDICYLIGNGQVGVPPIKGGTWSVYATSGWTVVPGVVTIALDKTQAAEARRKRSDGPNKNTMPPAEMEDVPCVELSNIKGHAGQMCLNGFYVRIPEYTKNSCPVYEFTGGECFGFNDIVLFKDAHDRWRASSRSGHLEAGTDICYLMGYNCSPGSPANGSWYVFGGKKWECHEEIKSTKVDDPEVISAALRRKDKMARTNEHLKKNTKGVRISGLGGSAGQECLNGDYILMENYEKNGHPVYMFTGGTVFGHDDMVLFYDDAGRWRVASKSDNVEGDNDICYVMGNGLTGSTPLGAGDWQLHIDGKWTTKSEVRVRALDDAEAFAALLRAKEIKEREGKEDIDHTGVRFSGIKGPHDQETLNGDYILDKSFTQHGRPTYTFTKKAFGHDDLILSFDKDGRWRVSSKSAHIIPNTNICYLLGSGFKGKMPFSEGGTWTVHNSNDKKWQPVNGAIALPIRKKGTISPTKDVAPSMPNLKPENSRDFLNAEDDSDTKTASSATFPNFGVSLKFLRQIADDPRLKTPMFALPYVSSGVFGTKGSLTKPLNADTLESLEVSDLKKLAMECRAFSNLDGDEEFARYLSDKHGLSKQDYIDQLKKCPTTTTHVNIFIVKPDTLTSSCCYCEMLVRKSNDAGDIVGKPTIFLSHAWRYRFETLITAVESHFANRTAKEREEARVWNDIFVEDQNCVNSKPKDYFFYAFKDAIGHIGNTLLVLDPWDQPIPFSRSWCVWEIYSTICTNAKLDVALSPSGRHHFWNALVNNFHVIVNVISSINAAKASAFCEEDKIRIDQTIRDSVGFFTVNRMISDRMREWLAFSGTTLLREESDESGIDMSLAEKGKLTTCLASLLIQQGNMETAEKLLRKGLKCYEEHFGQSEPETLDVVVKLGTLLRDMKKFEDAAMMFRRHLRANEDSYGKDHVETMMSMNRLARLLGMTETGQDEAEAMMRENLTLCKTKLGTGHPRYVTALDDFWDLLRRRTKYEEAETFCREALRANEKSRGRDHPSTMKYLDAMSDILRSSKKHAAAERIARRWFKSLKSTLGGDHDDTLNASSRLALILKDMDSAEEASKRMREILASRLSSCEEMLSMFSAKCKANAEDDLFLMDRFASIEKVLIEMKGSIKNSEKNLKSKGGIR